MARISKIYGDPNGYQIQFNRDTGELIVTNLILGAAVGGGSGTAMTSTVTELNTLHSSGVTNADLVKLHGLTPTAAQINTVATPGAVTLAAGALSAAANGLGKINIHSAAAGVAMTLPLATGSGVSFKIIIQTLVATSPLTFTCAGSDKLVGSIFQSKSAADVIVYAANGTSNTAVSLNGSTTGGAVGDNLEFFDVASGIWFVKGWTLASGTVASPIS